jgi:hypothetical protein
MTLEMKSIFLMVPKGEEEEEEENLIAKFFRKKNKMNEKKSHLALKHSIIHLL